MRHMYCTGLYESSHFRPKRQDSLASTMCLSFDHVLASKLRCKPLLPTKNASWHLTRVCSFTLNSSQKPNPKMWYTYIAWSIIQLHQTVQWYIVTVRMTAGQRSSAAYTRQAIERSIFRHGQALLKVLNGTLCFWQNCRNNQTLQVFYIPQL